ncbi:MAG: DUF2231 domain-containing protein [Acidobacteriota bacterium]
MTTWITSLTSLPNLHPALVHFPIALLLTALGFEIACLVPSRHRVWLDRVTALLYALGTLAAAATYLSGRDAEDSLSDVPTAAQPIIAAHADWALRTLLFFVLLAVVRVVATWLQARAGKPLLVSARLGFVAAGMVGAWLLFQTADRGGALVFRHGVAVRPMTQVQEKPKTTEPAAPSGSPALHLSEEGSLAFSPGAGDETALGTILKDPEGGAPLAVRVVPSTAHEPGLTLEVNGKAMMVFDPVFRDVEVAATFDLSHFSGHAGVLHHVRGKAQASGFSLSTDGQAQLFAITPAGERTLDQARVAAPRSETTITATASGRHLKGMVDGATVAHGHEDSGSEGKVGLLLEGSGTVRLLKVRAVPLSGH